MAKSCEWEHLGTSVDIIAYRVVGTPPAEPDADGWIEWKGGECPVPDSTIVKVRFRSNDESARPCRADWHAWDHVGARSDIIAYRVVKEKEA
ncbi:MAG: hypothetical protein CME87_08830 [Herbaspirillum sp.]|nr:hypothetical protein [Herbaspirillum sp.]